MMELRADVATEDETMLGGSMALMRCFDWLLFTLEGTCICDIGLVSTIMLKLAGY